MPPPEGIGKVLNIKKREVAGLESLLRLHKFVGSHPASGEEEQRRIAHSNALKFIER